VREAFGDVPFPADGDHPRLRRGPNGQAITWRADWLGNPSGFKWKPSIHMPRWASRITLEITAIRGERLHAITNDDARNEGFVARQRESESDAFHNLWDVINGQGSWATNPLVWVVSFKRIDN
jgi:hypothetical protein